MSLSVAFPGKDLKNRPQISPVQLWCWKRHRAAVLMFLRPGTWDDDQQDSMPGGQSSGSLSASFFWTGGTARLNQGWSMSLWLLRWFENIRNICAVSNSTRRIHSLSLSHTWAKIPEISTLNGVPPFFETITDYFLKPSLAHFTTDLPAAPLRVYKLKLKVIVALIGPSITLFQIITK